MKRKVFSFPGLFFRYLLVLSLSLFLFGLLISPLQVQAQSEEEVGWWETIKAEKLDVVFALDSSYDMAYFDSNDLRVAASEFFVRDKLEKIDQAGVISWDDDIDFSFGLSDDYPQVLSQLGNVDSSGGEVRDYDRALNRAIDMLEGDGGEETGKAIIFVSDNYSQNYTPAAQGGPAAKAAEKGIKIYGISVLGDISYEGPIQDMAEATGGGWFVLQDEGDFIPLFERIVPMIPPEPPEPTPIEQVNKIPVATHGGRGLLKDDLEKGFVLGEVLIFFNSEVSEATVREMMEEYGFVAMEEVPTLGTYYKAVLKDGSVENTFEVKEKLLADPRVDVAFLNWLQDTLQFNDPGLEQQRHLEVMKLFRRVEELFPTLGARSTIVVVDSGIDYQLIEGPSPEVIAPPGQLGKGLELSPDVEQAVWDATDKMGHGTEVATISAAQADNESFGVGIAYKAEVISIKVFGESGRTTMHHVGTAMLAATQFEADVVNMSLGCNFCFHPVHMKQRRFYRKVLDQLEDAYFQGKIDHPLPIFVGAAGNDGGNIVHAPAGVEGVISVGSYNPEEKKKSKFANYGPQLDFVSLGEDVMTAKLDGEFGSTGDGTSFSAPQVTGLIALMLSARSELKGLGPEGIKKIIARYFTEDVGAEGWDEETGYGLVTLPDPAESGWMIGVGSAVGSDIPEKGDEEE